MALRAVVGAVHNRPLLLQIRFRQLVNRRGTCLIAVIVTMVVLVVSSSSLDMIVVVLIIAIIEILEY